MIGIGAFEYIPEQVRHYWPLSGVVFVVCVLFGLTRRLSDNQMLSAANTAIITLATIQPP